MNDESRQTRRIDLLSPARWNGLAILGIVFVLLLLTEIALRSSLRRGWTNYTESESVSFLAVDSQGQAWAAVYDMNQYVRTDSIVMFPADEEPVHIPLPEALATDVVQFLKIDVEDRIWLGTVSGMLAVRDIDDRWRVFSSEHSEAPSIGSETVIDGQGQAWTNSPQTYGTELARVELHPESRTYTLANAGLGLIDTLAVDEQGQLWVLSANGELKMLEPDGSWTTLGTARKQDPDVNWAFSPFGNARLAINRQGQAWIGVANGVVHMLGFDGTLQTYSPDESHPTIYTKGITIDGQGYMWGVSGGQGLYRFHPQMGWTAYNPRNSGLTATYSVTTLVADRQGRVWIGASDGELVRFDPAVALPSNYIPMLSLLSVIVLPAALLSIGLVMVAMIVFKRPSAIDRQAIPKLWPIALGTLGAAFCGLYALGQRHVLADQFMRAVFGEGWDFADALSFFVAPALSICLVPLAAMAGAALGVLFVRLAAKILLA